MTEFVYRITAICPANIRPAMQAISEALGYGGGTFSLPLYPVDGTAPTYYASSTVATPRFYAMLTDAATQDAVLASIDWAEWGFIDEDEARAILRGQEDADPPVMVIGSNTAAARDQLQALMDLHGLSREPADPEDVEP